MAEDTFYKSFSERADRYGAARRSRIERTGSACSSSHPAPGRFVEIGPGHGTLGELAVAAGWHYTAIEASDL